MLPVIQTGGKVLITMKTGIHTRHTYTSHVADVLGEHALLVYTPISKGNLVRLPEGEDYVFLFFARDELLQAVGTIMEHCVQKNIYYIKISYGSCTRLQRRNFFRLNCILDFQFTDAPEPEDESKPDEMPVYKGIIKNISGGGIFFVSARTLSENGKIRCQLPLNSQNASVKGRVAEARPSDTADDLFQYRIEFIDIEPAMQEKIVQFVFDLQFQMLKKLRENQD